MKIAVLGVGNVGIAEAADLTTKGHEVTLIKTSSIKSEVFERLQKKENKVLLKDHDRYHEAKIKGVTNDITAISTADIVLITIQSTYYEELVKRICAYLRGSQIVICTSDYMSSFYFAKHCEDLPTIAETTGPYIEGRIDLDDIKDEVVFRVGCRLNICPLSLFNSNGNENEIMDQLHNVFKGYRRKYSTIEAAMLNPNMVLHTVGSVMSLSRIEYSKGDFCMYREAYSRENQATLNIMFQLDDEKKKVLSSLGQKPIGILEAGGFGGAYPMESFYKYAASPSRAQRPCVLVTSQKMSHKG